MILGKWFWPDTWPKAILVWAVVMMLLLSVIVALNIVLYGVHRALDISDIVKLSFIGGPALWIGILVLKANLILQKKLQTLASTDELTGLNNRRAFFEKIDHLAQEEGGLLVVLDADFFKQINDTYGHAAGDETLIKIAHLLRDAARSHDVVGRLGGEEFGLFLTAVDPKHAHGVLARICAGVTLHHAGGRQMTLSAGGALLKPGAPIDAAVRQADEALYAAKRMGRKRFVFVGDSSDPARRRAQNSTAA